MPVSFEKEYPQAFEVYLSVMTDPTVARGLSIKDLVSEGYARCMARGLTPNNPDRDFKQGQSGYEWARKNKQYMALYELYANKGLEPQDQPFSLGMLNDQFQGLINTDLQYRVMTQAMNELNAIHITPTVRVIKWIGRFAHTPYVPTEYSFLRTIGFGSVAPRDTATGKIIMPFVMGTTDMAFIYAQKEKEAVSNKLDTRWDSSELDKNFFMPVSAQKVLKKEPLKFSFPYLNTTLEKMIGELNKNRYEKKLFSELNDTNYRDSIWTLLNKEKNND